MGLDSNSVINAEALQKHCLSEVNKQMLLAAEPILQKALKEIEATMRKELATRLIAMINTDYSMERQQHQIRITIKQAKDNASPFA